MARGHHAVPGYDLRAALLAPAHRAGARERLAAQQDRAWILISARNAERVLVLR
jgi:hypothetical protein